VRQIGRQGDAMQTTAVVVRSEGGAPEVAEIEVAPPGPGEVRIRIAASGICGSDLHVLRGTSPVANPPLVLGHEGAGVVEAVGPGVTSVGPGDHVVVALYGPCLRCEPCLTGDLARCRGPERVAAISGLMADGSTRVRDTAGPLHPFVGIGSMAGLAVVRESQVVRIDPAMPLELACLAGCGVTTGLGAVFNTARLLPGSTVLVVGAGGVGLSVVQGARIAGAVRIIAVDPNPVRRALAHDLGATDVVDPGATPMRDAVRALEPDGVDAAFEVVGDTGLVAEALASTRAGGTCVMVGSPPVGSVIGVDARTLFEGRRLVGCVGGDNVPRRDIPRVVALHRRGDLHLDALASARFPLGGIADAVAGMTSGDLARAVLVVDPDLSRGA
jgi:S-(hydroxymethyl)glutathione dehydrogenase / alcohol dehydrogenase